MLAENIYHLCHYLTFKDWYFVAVSKEPFYDKETLFRTRDEAVAWALTNLDDVAFTIQTLKEADGWMWAGTIESLGIQVR